MKEEGRNNVLREKVRNIQFPVQAQFIKQQVLEHICYIAVRLICTDMGLEVRRSEIIMGTYSFICNCVVPMARRH